MVDFKSKSEEAPETTTPLKIKKKPLRKKEEIPPSAGKLILDRFQTEANKTLQSGHSLIVSAPTGNGKTLVAEMLAWNLMAAERGMIYTSPLKALSNQKYRDFRNCFGAEQVGLVTGDVSVNPGAPLIIMTTEIFRNWCLSEPHLLKKMAYVVFDEIHYLDDAERGTTWEESILFAPPHIKILGLSATVPNIAEMADWISSVREEKVFIVKEHRRYIPLETRWILPDGQLMSEKNARHKVEKLTERLRLVRNNKSLLIDQDEPSCSGIIEIIQDKLPALFFVFSRGRTEALAAELGREWDFLNLKEKRNTGQIIREAEMEHPGAFSGPGWRNLRRLLLQGIAYHHAGLLPPVKYLVESLYSQRLLWVVFCTETFAAGVNFPAASAVFDSTRKWDGHDFRLLQNREFFQMAGRAGRRGFDRIGHAFVRVDSRFPEQTGFFSEKAVEPVLGRLVISPNTVLSLLKYKTDTEINHFLTCNFKTFQLKKKKELLTEKIETLSAQITGQQELLCPDSFTLICPLERLRARKHLKRLRYRGKNREKELLQNKLASVNSSRCRHTEKCRPVSFKVRKLQARLDKLQHECQIASEQLTACRRDFDVVRNLLERLGYIKGREFYPRGNFALEMHVQEILVTEMAFAGLIEDNPPAEVAALLAGVEFIPSRSTQVVNQEIPLLKEGGRLKKELLQAGVPEHFCIWSSLPGPLAHAWFNGATFKELLEMCSLQPGDVFSLFRREIDLLRQVERAAGENKNLAERANLLRSKLDRDEIALSF
ncbi:MAG: DEAD/DEAH box helicase [Peptococcaceae bacterium]|nr:MAG: DEAD/DEAH box helicase [Peptococcaceae bacterium]